MVKSFKTNEDEINLIELMLIVARGKWKIVIAAIISLIIMISIQSNSSNNFTAITEIKPLSSISIKKYDILNSVFQDIDGPTSFNENDNKTKFIENNNTTIVKDIFIMPQITISKFLDLYLDILQDRLLIEKVIRDFKLIDASQYNNDKEYNAAIIRLASSVKISSPPSTLDKENLSNSYHTIEFVYNDVEKWKSVLRYLDQTVNQMVKETLLNEYSNALFIANEQKRYALEDISTQIDNLLIDYEREVSDRISYLKEQSEIAEKLGIAKNTIEVQAVGNERTLLSNIKTDSPFYLRGYEAIDKEIELILLRDNKKAFMKGLFDLEKKKRALEQDQTLKRSNLIVNSSILLDNKEFVAATIQEITTKFNYKDKRKPRIQAIAMGLIVGVLYVIISNAFVSYNVSRKKTK